MKEVEGYNINGPLYFKDYTTECEKDKCEGLPNGCTHTVIADPSAFAGYYSELKKKATRKYEQKL